VVVKVYFEEAGLVILHQQYLFSLELPVLKLAAVVPTVEADVEEQIPTPMILMSLHIVLQSFPLPLAIPLEQVAEEPKFTHLIAAFADSKIEHDRTRMANIPPSFKKPVFVWYAGAHTCALLQVARDVGAGFPRP
jgi:hypothetical protein